MLFKHDILTFVTAGTAVGFWRRTKIGGEVVLMWATQTEAQRKVTRQSDANQDQKTLLQIWVCQTDN